MQFSNQIILITGASSGIGEQCAEYFAVHGAKLILAARRRERLQAQAADYQERFSTECMILELDVSQTREVATHIAELPEQWQHIDILINNAGLAAGLDRVQTAKLEDWETMVDTNVKGLMAVTHAILPGMVERNKGHIINIGSIAGHQVYPKGAVYCATKHAVRAFTEGLKMDLLGTAVRVSSVDPGLVSTEFSMVRFEGNTERAKAVYQDMTPLTATDIAETVGFVASRPPHVNISEILVMATDQASATLVHRRD